jgi:hypothetical protein
MLTLTGSRSDTWYMSYCDIKWKKDRSVQGLTKHVVKAWLEGSDLIVWRYILTTFSPVLLYSQIYMKIMIHMLVEPSIKTVEVSQRTLQKKPLGINEKDKSHFQKKRVISAVVWKDKTIVSAISTIHMIQLLKLIVLYKLRNMQFSPTHTLSSNYGRLHIIYGRCRQVRPICTVLCFQAHP